MIVNVLLNECGELCAFSSHPMTSSNGVHSFQAEVDGEFDLNRSGGYRLVNGKLVFSEEKWEIYKETTLIPNEIREQRDEECFSIVNRGGAWYRAYVNTPERQAEFDAWYQAWLEAPETRIIPEKPSWIN